MTDAASAQSAPLRVEQARSAMLERIVPIAQGDSVELRSALGRVLARDVVSPIDVPSHRNSAMDGYAVRSEDLASAHDAVLRVIGSAFAGHPFRGRVGPGECVRIMTGAAMPEGSDTVVMQEIVTVEAEKSARIPPGQHAGQNVRDRGEDLRAGHCALPAGRLLRPAEIGLLASLGIERVDVLRPVRVAMFSTGDEVCSPGTATSPGQVYDSNRYTLWGMLTRLGCEIVDLGIVRDEPVALEAALRKAAEADAIVTSGGISGGEADFVRDITAALGDVAFWKIAMKPGRPMAFGNIGAAKLFGLPGNPVATMVAFYQFVRPALLAMAGVTPSSPPPSFLARCTEPLRKAKGRTEFVRGIMSPADDEWQVRPTGAQGSGILRSMAEANCFIVLDHEQGNVGVGDNVRVQPFEGLV